MQHCAARGRSPSASGGWKGDYTFSSRSVVDCGMRENAVWQTLFYKAVFNAVWKLLKDVGMDELREVIRWCTDPRASEEVEELSLEEEVRRNLWSISSINWLKMSVKVWAEVNTESNKNEPCMESGNRVRKTLLIIILSPASCSVVTDHELLAKETQSRDRIGAKTFGFWCEHVKCYTCPIKSAEPSLTSTSHFNF